MTIDQLIAQVRQSLADRLTQRATHTQTIETVRAAMLAEQRDVATDDEATRIRAAQDAQRTIDTEIEQLQARETELLEEQRRDAAAAALAREVTPGATPPGAPARVTGEARTYTRETAREVSFFADAYRAQYASDLGARDRLERHAREVQVEHEVQVRATTTGSFAGLVVPQYLTQFAALALRNGRPVANTCTSLPLPDQGTQFNVPRGTTAGATAIQATENSSVQSTDEVWANVTVNIATIAGQQDVSRQSLERGIPGLDELIYLDLAGAYMANLDSQVINGSGSAGQMLGFLNTSGINAATAFGAAVTAANFTLKLAGAEQAIYGAGTILAARFIAVHPRRLGWLHSLVDSQNRPLFVPAVGGPTNALGFLSEPGENSAPSAVSTEVQVVGYMLGIPVITDANIPTTVGTLNEDVVLVYDNRNALLFEDGDGMPNQLRFEQTLGNQLTVKLVVYGYAAFTAGRYPAATSKIGGLDTVAGQGLIAPTF